MSTSPVEDINEVVKVGDTLDLVVISTIGKDKENGSYLLSKRRLDAKKVWEDIEKDFQAGNIIEAPVTNVVKGGLVVDVGVRGFVPASMVEDHFVADFSEYKGQTLAFKIDQLCIISLVATAISFPPGTIHGTTPTPDGNTTGHSVAISHNSLVKISSLSGKTNVKAMTFVV